MTAIRVWFIRRFLLPAALSAIDNMEIVARVGEGKTVEVSPMFMARLDRAIGDIAIKVAGWGYARTLIAHTNKELWIDDNGDPGRK